MNVGKTHSGCHCDVVVRSNSDVGLVAGYCSSSSDWSGSATRRKNLPLRLQKKRVGFRENNLSSSEFGSSELSTSEWLISRAESVYLNAKISIICWDNLLPAPEVVLQETNSMPKTK